MTRTTARARLLALAAAAATAVATVGATALPAQAAEAAAAATAGLATTSVTADALPTVQINGVVWSQVVVGDRVYATGQFTSARPAGSPAGSNEVARSNILAYDITTGSLISSWAPSLNGTGLGLAASPDGKRIYVVGSFTSVNGTTRNRVAALDASTGALITSFNPNVNSRVRTVAATSSTVYLGGEFSAVAGQARTRLAAVSASNGSLLPWTASADAEPYAMVMPSSTAELVVAGRFTTLGGQSALGSGALDLTTGAPLPWAVQERVNDYGPKAAIYSLSTDGDTVYGTGYNFGGSGNLENTYAASAAGGTLKWVNGCYGDTYSSFPSAGVLYTAGHAHNCAPVGGHPQEEPWTFQRALAFTTAAGTTNSGGNFNGLPGAKVVQWLPTLSQGTFTGQAQAAWSVTGDSRYVVMGGEFPAVNGTAQQGLVRFAVRSLAPNKQGPTATSADLKPTLVSLQGGTVRASVRAAWDRDDATLTYELLRGTNLATAPVVATATVASAWWSRPAVALTDRSAPAGTQSYRVRVKDSTGNVLASSTSTVDVATGAQAASAYRDAVLADGAQHLWRLDEASGTTAYDSAGASDLVLDPSATRAVAGATGDGDTATTFTGTADVPAATQADEPGPQVFSTEAWFSTKSTTGGKIVGFGNSSTGASSGYDRHIYMTNDGRLVAGTNGNGLRTATTSKRYNDGAVHQVVMTAGSGGLSLYVDGALAARDAGAVGAQPFDGRWRIGGDNLDWWPSAPSSRSFAGTIDDVSVYPTELTKSQVASHFTAAGGTGAAPAAAPTDAYGAAVYAAQPDLYWRLQEASGTTAADSSPDGLSPGAVSGAVSFGAAGVPGLKGSTGATLGGAAGDGLGTTTPRPGPSTYSEELWFSTTSTDGGKLIGFGGSPNGYSGSYDRHVWMDRDGTLHFGTWTGTPNTADSTKAYNDGAWHHVVATQGPAGMALYVDGALVGSNPQTSAQGYDGYWRVGGDSSWGSTANGFIAAKVDEVAVYPTVLSATEVSRHHALGAGGTANAAPTAAFTSSVTGLAAALDASTSTDADGTVASYAWTFGDGTSGTGKTASHTYAAAGTYQVALTVTDDKGATGTVMKSVVVAQAPVTALAQDDFARTSTGGWGSAVVGGAWTATNGAASAYAVDGGAATITVSRAGANNGQVLAGVSATDVDLTTTVAVDRAATGGATSLSAVVRRTSAGDYRARVRLLTDGRVAIAMTRWTSAGETVVGGERVVQGLTATGATSLQLRAQAVGSGTTTLQARVWATGAAEPTTWQTSATDATSGYQDAGSVGVATYLSSSSTGAPLVVTFRQFQVTRP